MRDPLLLLEPQTRAFIQSVRAAGGLPISSVSVEQARQLMRGGQACPLDIEGIDREVLQVSGCSTHVLRPEGASGRLPVILYLHGGGWVLGGFDTHARLVQELVRLTGAVVVFPEYSLAPEAPFPQGIEECYNVLAWIESQRSLRYIDGSRIAVVGDSSGGNLAAAVAILAAQRGGPTLRLQALLCPVTDFDLDRPIYAEFGQGFYLDRDAMEWFWTHYAPNSKDRRTPLASPLRTPLNDLRDVAPALVITAECDVLRDEGEEYGRRLSEAGVPTATYRCLGTVHSFLLENKLAGTPPAVSAMRTLSAHLTDALSR